MADLATVIMGITFVAWFAVSVGSQLSDRVSQRLPRLETLGLIPHWTFFAPRPSMHDMHLLYRDRLDDDEVGEIAFVPTIEVRRWYHAIWNPEKFRNKVIADVSVSLGLQFLATDKSDGDLRLVMLSVPYMMAVHLVMQMPRTENVKARQFILARQQSYGQDPDRQLIFLSEFHGV